MTLPTTREEARAQAEGIDPDILCEIASELLNIASAPHTIWLPADLDNALESYPEERREEIRDAAQDTYAWNHLGDAQDVHWIAVEIAVEDAAAKLGVKLAPKVSD